MRSYVFCRIGLSVLYIFSLSKALLHFLLFSNFLLFLYVFHSALIVDACYDKCGTSRLNCFLNDGAAQPHIVGTTSNFCMSFVVCLGRGSFHPVALLLFSKQLFGRVLSSQVAESKPKQWCTSIVARVCWLGFSLFACFIFTLIVVCCRCIFRPCFVTCRRIACFPCWGHRDRRK